MKFSEFTNTKKLETFLEALENPADEPEEIVAFPTKYSDYEQDYVIIYADGAFFIFNENQEVFEVFPDQSELFNVLLDFFNAHDERVAFEDFIEELPDDIEIDWASDSVIMNASKDLESHLPEF
jgi:hypothetical protein